jgi:hypothetical protein
VHKLEKQRVIKRKRAKSELTGGRLTTAIEISGTKPLSKPEF